MKITLIALNARYTHSAPALFYVRNALKARLPGCCVTLQQHTINDPYHATLLTIAASEPAALFFSVYIWSSAVIERLLVDLRQLFPEIPLVLGGPQAPHLRLPAKLGHTVVHGPVEGLPDTFYDALARCRLAPSYRAAPGAGFTMPYRPADFSGPLRHRALYYEASRGCPFACSYCLSAVERGMRTRSLDEITGELALILAQRPAMVRFVDRTFNAAAERALAIWQYLLAQPGDTCFHFEIAPDLFTQTMLDFLATVPAGRFQFEIGLQSTHPPTLAAVNRQMDLERALANIRALVAMDTIHLHVDLILGLPAETQASYRQSCNTVFALGSHYVQMGLLKVLPGTPLADQAAEFGLVHSASPPYGLLANRWLDQDALAELYWFGEVVEAFYNNRYFRALFAYLRRKESDLFAFFKGLAAIYRHHGFFGRARTQELLSAMLGELAVSRPDHGLFLALLRYDWLACGHRFVPDHLGPLPLKETRDALWRRLPAAYPPLFNEQERSEFFKRGVFAPFSAELLSAVGFAAPPEGGVVCFLAEDAAGVLPRRRTVLLPVAAGS